MKNKLFFISFFLLANLTFSQFNENAPWMLSSGVKKQVNKNSEKNSYSLPEISKMFNDYWVGKDPTKKGSGYKPFKRWENFWEYFVDENGYLPSNSQLWESWKNHQQFLAQSQNDQSNWKSIGPNTLINSTSSIANLGRINVIVPDPNNENIIYAGAPSGGIWKSLDKGLTWVPISDSLPQIGVSGIAVDSNDSNIIYITTGDDDASDTYSAGVFKTTNGGVTWNETGLNPSNSPESMNDIYIHPTNSNILFVATNQGLYKSIDAGVNWNKKVNGNIKDLKLKPNMPTTLYVVTTNKFYSSIDEGESFVQVETGLPTSSGRFVIDVTPANPNYVYVLSSNTDNTYQGVYKSVDSGLNFELTSNSVDILESDQAWFDLALAVSDTNAEEIYVGCLNIWKSSNGGNTFIKLNNWASHTPSFTHADIHFLRFYNNKLYAGTDGGFYLSSDGGTTFQDLTQGMQIGQFYKISVSPKNASKIAGGLQDNGGFGLTNDGDWSNYHSGDGMDNAIDPNNENKYYGFTQNGGVLTISNNAGVSGGGSYDGPEEGNWVTPLEVNSEGELYAGYSSLYKFTDDGFEKISSSFANRIDELEIDSNNANVMYVGINKELYRSTNRGIDFERIETFAGNVRAVSVNSSDSNIVYIATSGSGSRGIFRSTDMGENFSNISYDLPQDQAYFDIVHQGRHSLNPLFVATSLGVFRFDDSANEWQPFVKNLPNVPVRDLEISLEESKITVGTYGRGVWQSEIAKEIPEDEIRLIKLIAPNESKIIDGETVIGLKVENKGENSIELIKVIYSIDNENEVIYNWSGIINAGNITTINIPSISTNYGVHSLNVSIEIENDAYNDNNSISGNFISNEQITDNALNTFEETTDSLLSYTQGNLLSSEWERGTPRGILLNAVASGSKAYATNLDGNHGDYKKSFILSKFYDLSEIIFPKFKFNMAYDLEENWDIIYVEYSTNKGGNWEVLGSKDDLNWYNSNRTNEISGSADDCQNCPGAQWTGTNTAMSEYSYDLASLASKKEVLFRFVFHSDPAVNQEGVVIDDFIISQEGIDDDDDDNDGILDVDDNCPKIPNPDQADADNDGVGDVCDEDSDNDGISNDIDNCPSISNSDQLDTDNDGIGDVCDDDDDNDGILDAIDNCPLISNASQTDENNNGIGDICEDDDNDGIKNGLDNCPEIHNPEQADADNDGIGDDCDEDVDGDGVLNINDNCPLKSNSDQGDANNDGVGDACQDEDGDGYSNLVDNCPSIANVDQADFDNDGIGDVCDDDIDGDGVLNVNDNCNNTPLNSVIDIIGCVLFTLPSSNFKLEINSETCRESNNGYIVLLAEEDLNYTATISGNGVIKTEAFTNSITFEELSSGNYTVCVNVESEPEYEICFNSVITEPDALSVFSKIDVKSGTASLDLSGAVQYFVTLNDETFVTSKSKLNLILKPGINKMKVSTNLNCQGEYFETFVVPFTGLKLYPNPVKRSEQLFLTTGNISEDFTVSIYSPLGSLITHEKMFVNSQKRVGINIEFLPKGIYFLNLESMEVNRSFTIIIE